MLQCWKFTAEYYISFFSYVNSPPPPPNPNNFSKIMVLQKKSEGHCWFFMAATGDYVIEKHKWKLLSCVWLFATPSLYSPWNSPGQNTGVGSHSLLQGILPTLNWDLLNCRQIFFFLPTELPGKSEKHKILFKHFRLYIWAEWVVLFIEVWKGWQYSSQRSGVKTGLCW